MHHINPCSSADEADAPLAPRRDDASRPPPAPLRPDFLVISPPKTGSTWLADNLRRHPQIFLPAVKEVKYFSSFLKSLDLDWYLNHFAAAAGRVKGEASPCYSLLPVGRIRLVRRLMPRVKLVYLMRDPVERAWSHAKHNHRYGEANFAPRPSALGSVTDGQWRANFVHDWPLASGDYLGQLRRWLAVFPREQIHVGFYEDIAGRPAALLREVFSFLGVDPDVDLSAFPVREPHPARALELSPGNREFLHWLLDGRTAELAGFLKGRLGLEPPAGWGGPSGGAAGPRRSRGWDDRRLGRVLDQAATFRSAYRLAVEDWLGYRIVSWQGRLYAVARPLDAADVCRADVGDAEAFRPPGIASSAARSARSRGRVARARAAPGSDGWGRRARGTCPRAAGAPHEPGGRPLSGWRRLRSLLASWLAPWRRRPARHAG